MWLFTGAGLSVVIILAAWRIAVDRHRKRQNRSMRDHLNRITSSFE